MFPCLQAELGDHLVLAQPHSRQLFILNPVAAMVWEARSHSNSEEGIALLLTERFAIPLEQALGDVRGIIGQIERMPEWFDAAHRGSNERDDSGPLESVKASCAWKADLSMAGTSLRLQVEDVEWAEKLIPIVSHLAHDGNSLQQTLELRGQGASWTLLLNGRRCGQVDPDPVASTIHHLVEIACRPNEQLLIVHGAGLARSGQGVLLAGRGGSGKTTLCAALNASSLELLSDDVVPVTPSGKLLGIGMSLCLKRGSWPVLARHIAALEQTGDIIRFGRRVKFVPPPGPIAQKPVRAGLFLFPKFRPGDPEVVALQPVDVLQKMIEAESLLLDLDQEKLSRLVAWVASAPGYTLGYPDLDTGLAQVHRLMNEHGL